MERAEETALVAASLSERVASLGFTDRSADEVTALLLASVVAWATGLGWRVYQGATSVFPLPPPFQHRHSILDVACARPSGPPVVVEIDRTDRRRTVEKLLAEAAAGRIALWLRWGAGGFSPPPAPIGMVTCAVTARSVLGERGRRFSRRSDAGRPAPEHTEPATGSAEQSGLFEVPKAT